MMNIKCVLTVVRYLSQEIQFVQWKRYSIQFCEKISSV